MVDTVAMMVTGTTTIDDMPTTVTGGTTMADITMIATAGMATPPHIGDGSSVGNVALAIPDSIMAQG